MLANKWTWILLVLIAVALIARHFMVSEGYKRPKKCNVDTKKDLNKYFFRTRMQRDVDGKTEWQCPSGWEDTGCDWVDDKDRQKKQCRRSKTKSGTTKTGDFTGGQTSVFLYSEPNFKGDKLEIPVDQYFGNLNDKGWNDKAQSIVVPQLVSASIWNDKNSGGDNWYIQGPAKIADLGKYCLNPAGQTSGCNTDRYWHGKRKVGTNGDGSDAYHYDGITSIEVKRKA